jgi:hypothetical protein
MRLAACLHAHIAPTGFVKDVHHRLLALRVAQVFDHRLRRRGPEVSDPRRIGRLLLPWVSGKNETEDYSVCVHARTWLSDDMLQADQVPLVEDEVPRVAARWHVVVAETVAPAR